MTILKINCWELKQCGREPGGRKVNELGVCPAATDTRVFGVNGGINGGRVCWAIAGTFCDAKVQGSFALKVGNCMQCDFFNLVVTEEGRNLMKTNDVLAKLKDKK